MYAKTVLKLCLKKKKKCFCKLSDQIEEHFKNLPCKYDGKC